MLKKYFKILLRIFPDFLIFALSNFLIRIKYGVRIGRGSKIYTNSYFEGHNAILNNTLIYGSYVGLCTYISNNSNIGMTKIGRFCAIGDNFRTMLGRHPSKDFVSIHPVFYSIKKVIDFTFTDKQKFDEHLYVDFEKRYVVEIGNDVWIGNNVTIMDGLKIGDGAIIGAGAVVTKNVDPYAIVVGVPAKLVKYRFPEEQIKFLLNFKWWDKDLGWIKNNYNYFSDISIFIKNV
jgi:acetyltransferase-like isoleucine patch superfamily enzyme